MAFKTKKQVKKEFNEFAEKVAKLEFLRQELNALNARGFEPEVKLIRSKLKNIDSIPQIEREINELRNKIKVKLSKHGLKGISAEALKSKISYLEKLIKKKRQIRGKKQLSDKEVEFVKDVPSLEKGLESLREEFKKHVGPERVKVEPAVGNLVDGKFAEFISSIKAELTKRLKERERGLDLKARTNLRSQEKLFSQKYKDLVGEFHEKYKEKVHTDLRNYIKRNFEDELAKRLGFEREMIINSLLRKDAARLENERKALARKLESHYSKEEEKLMKEKTASERQNSEGKEKLMKEKMALEKQKKKLEEIKSKEHSDFISRMEKIKKANDKKINRKLKQREAELRAKLDKEYSEEMKIMIIKKEEELKRKKIELEKHIIEHAKSLFN